MNINKTIIEKSNIDTKWYIVDAQKYRLGRLVSYVTCILKDKDSITYLPNKKSTSNIIITNSKNVQVTGRKNKQKIYKRHSGRPGGLKTENFEKLQKRIPNRIIENALKGMLPKNTLGRQLLKNVRIYSNGEHPHKSQNPVEINID